MGKKQREMSEYEYSQADKFIRHLYFRYGKGLDYEECRGIAFLEYAEVRKDICEIYNQELLWVWAGERIIEAFRSVRKNRNERCRLEAKFSMNQTIGESVEPVYTYFFPAKGNFVNTVCLWYDMKALGTQRYGILLGLYLGHEDWEVMQFLELSADEYFNLKESLRTELREYMSDSRGGKGDGLFSTGKIL